MPLLQTKNLVKHFDGVYAVDHLSITIEPGQVTSIIGPNGSGKSTLINALTGLLPIDGGLIKIDDLNLSQIKPFDCPVYGLTRTFQEVRLFEQMTVLDNLLVVMTERNIFSALFERHKYLHLKKAEELLDLVDLKNKKHELAVNLSYGQRKLLEIARALSMNANIYLFDEPFAGLFPAMIEIVKNCLEHLKKQGATIILVEHNMDLIRQLSDHLIVLDEGKLLAQGKPDQVLKNKKVLAAYLGE